MDRFKIMTFLFLKLVLLMRIEEEMWFYLSAVSYNLFVLVLAYWCAVVLPVTVILITCFYILGYFVHPRKKPLIWDFTIISRPTCRRSRSYTVDRDLLLVFLNTFGNITRFWHLAETKSFTRRLSVRWKNVVHQNVISMLTSAKGE